MTEKRSRSGKSQRLVVVVEIAKAATYAQAEKAKGTGDAYCRGFCAVSRLMPPDGCGSGRRGRKGWL
jgi:hypothetical protein